MYVWRYIFIFFVLVVQLFFFLLCVCDCAEEAFPKLLGALCDGPGTVVEKLEMRPGLAKALAHLIHFSLTFDDLKVRVKICF